MNHLARVSLAVISLGALTACPPQMDPNIGTITVHNADKTDHAVLITQEDNCTLGLHSKVYSNNTTTFDVDRTTGSWMCVDEVGPAIKLEDGKVYEIKNGRLDFRNELQQGF